jgi:hypothetical protein
MEFKSTVCGIPCIIKITDYENTPATWHEPAYYLCEFEILDLNGNHAKWLERKMDDNDMIQAEYEIDLHMDQTNQYEI